MKRRLILALLLSGCAGHALKAPAPAFGSVTLELREHPGGRPMGGGQLRLRLDSLQERLSVATDSLGRTTLTGLEPGLYAVRVRSIGYIPVSLTLLVKAGRATLLSCALEKDWGEYMGRPAPEVRCTESSAPPQGAR